MRCPECRRETDVLTRDRCGACYQRHRKKGTAHTLPRKRVLKTQWREQKRCTWCKTIKPINEFYEIRTLGYARHAWCKDCVRAAARDDYWQRRKYRKHGITQEVYQKLLAAQDGMCGICRCEPTEEFPLALDHDHRCCPGKRSCGKCCRGLLCPKCNQGIGLLGDDPARLVRAAEYLRAA